MIKALASVRPFKASFAGDHQRLPPGKLRLPLFLSRVASTPNQNHIPTCPNYCLFEEQQVLTFANRSVHDAEIDNHSAPSLSSASQTVKFPGCTRGEWTTLYDGGISERFRETRGPTSSFCLASDVCLQKVPTPEPPLHPKARLKQFPATRYLIKVQIMQMALKF